MAAEVGLPTVPVSAAAKPKPTSSSSSTTTTSSTNSATLAGNFQTFLTLLTTQLQNQNPMDPLDTNQFTQQLVQFAQVEQQLKQNDQLGSLIALQKTTQATQALNFVGSTVVVDGTTGALKNGSAAWSLTSPKDVHATLNVMNSVGQTVYTGKFDINAGKWDFKWDGKGNDGVQWPDGDYKIQVVAKDAAGASTVVESDSQGVVDSVDLTATPPLLTIGTQKFTVDQIKRIIKGNSV
jgi:flagellar basal-body rod modification protein FlgD